MLGPLITELKNRESGRQEKVDPEDEGDLDRLNPGAFRVTSAAESQSASLTSRGRAQARQRERSRSLGSITGGAVRGREKDLDRDLVAWVFPSDSPCPLLAEALAEVGSGHLAQTSESSSCMGGLRAARAFHTRSPGWEVAGSLMRRRELPAVPSSELEEALKRTVGLLAFQKDSSAVPDCYSLAQRSKRFRSGMILLLQLIGYLLDTLTKESFIYFCTSLCL